MKTTEKTAVKMSNTDSNDEKTLKTFDFETLLLPSASVMRKDMAQWTKLCLIRLYPITLEHVMELKSHMSNSCYCTMKFGRDTTTDSPLKGMLMLHFLHPEDAMDVHRKLKTIVDDNVHVDMMNEDAKNFFNPDNAFNSPHINFKIQDNDAVVYVGNLPPNATEAALSEIFTQPKVRMAYNAEAAPLGYAYMFYENAELAEEAVQAHAMCTTLGGHLLAIKLMSKISCVLTDAQVSSLTRRKKTLESALSVIKDKNETVAKELGNKLAVVASKLQLHEQSKQSKAAAAKTSTFKAPTTPSETKPAETGTTKVAAVKASPRKSTDSPVTSETQKTAKATPPTKPVSKVTPTTTAVKKTPETATKVPTTEGTVTPKATKVTPARTATAKKVTPTTSTTKVTPAKITATKVTPAKATETKAMPAKTAATKVTPAKTATAAQKRPTPAKTTSTTTAVKKVTPAMQSKPAPARSTSAVAKPGPKSTSRVAQSRFAPRTTTSRFAPSDVKPTVKGSFRNGSNISRETARSTQFKRNFNANRPSFSRDRPEQRGAGGYRGYGDRQRSSPAPMWNEKPQWRADSNPPSLNWRSESDQFQSNQQQRSPFGQQQQMQQQIQQQQHMQQQPFMSQQQQQQPQLLFEQNTNSRQSSQGLYQQSGTLQQQQQQSQMYQHQQPQLQQQQSFQSQQPQKYVRPLQQFSQQDSSDNHQFGGNSGERYQVSNQASSNWNDRSRSPEMNLQSSSGVGGGLGDFQWASNESSQKRSYPSAGSGDYKRQRLSDTTSYSMDRTASGFNMGLDQRSSGGFVEQQQQQQRRVQSSGHGFDNGVGDQRRGNNSAINVLVGLSNVLGSRQTSGGGGGGGGQPGNNRGMGFRSTQSSSQQSRKSYGFGGGWS